MPWLQNYDPLHGPLSTVAAALPLVVLLGLLGVAPRPGPRRRALRAGRRAHGRHRRHRDAAGTGSPRGAARGRVRHAADRLDRAERDLPLPHHRGARRVRRASARHRGDHGRSSPAAPAHRFCVRRVLRRGGGIRNSGRRDGRDAHRAGLSAARGVGAVADREHGAGRVRRARHADHRSAGRDRTRPRLAERDGRAPAAVLLRDRAVLVDRRVRGFSRHARGVAGAARRGAVVRHPAISRVELPRALARRHRRVRVLDARARAFSCGTGDTGDSSGTEPAPPLSPTGVERTAPPLRVALIPWIVLVVVVFAWGTPQVKSFLNHISSPNIPIAGLDKMVARVPPVVPKATNEPAVFSLNWLSATGTAILHRGDHRGVRAPLLGDRPHSPLRDDVPRGLAIAAHDRGDARPRLHDAVLGRGRDPRTRLRAHGRRVSVLRGDARLARRRAHRERHVVERAVRESAEDHGDPVVARPACSWRRPTAPAA